MTGLFRTLGDYESRQSRKAASEMHFFTNLRSLK